MKRNLFDLLLWIAVTLSLSVVGCTKPNDSGNNSGAGIVSDDIVVTTYSPVDVTAFTAVCGGSVQVVQGLELTKIGICWSTSPNPTADGNQLSSEAWNEPFVRTLTGLSANTVYHVRAFALRGLEYYYGQDKTFTTLSEGGGGGNGGGTIPTLPVVTTLQMTDITQTTAVGGGYITDDGGATVLERGICWSTSSYPTVGDSHGSSGSGLGNYTVTIMDLMPNMTYHVRAYATNSAGTGYGNDVSFTTLAGGGGFVTPEAPTGAIRGLFSVSATKQVWFSKGNLQYIGSANTPYWKFADQQWSYLGDNGQGSYEEKVDRDYFGWGTSGNNHGAIYYQPWSIEHAEGYYNAYGVSTYNLFDQNGEADWGYNAISNGGNTIKTWRTLTSDEWDYVLHNRYTPSGIRFARAKVNGKNGLILLPDNWSESIYHLNFPNGEDMPEDYFEKNIISSSTWLNTMEPNGAVFLPAAGCRVCLGFSGENQCGLYWSSSHYDDSQSKYLRFNSTGMVGVGFSIRSMGLTVRLVQDYQ